MTTAFLHHHSSKGRVRKGPALLTINNGILLPGGTYRLQVCGTTSIDNGFGDTLDGNGDGTGGDDFLRHFSILLLDTDGDGLFDSLENTTFTDPNDADTDDDGILDGWEDTNHNGDQDAGETHPCKRDTDNDGIQDGTEEGYTLDDIGEDTDMGIFQPDLDPTTTTNPCNRDTDGDGLLDGDEDSNHNGRVDPGETDPIIPQVKEEFPWELFIPAITGAKSTN